MKLLKIGRDMSNDIVLQSNRVSSLHAEITLLDNGDIQLEDKGSSNGTFVMNQPIKPGKVVNIRRGDAIRFADVELQWSQVPMPEDNSAFKGIYGIGSNFNNDIQISGATVSRYHATVKQGKDGKMYIVDHSKNGTTVDGVKIPKDSLYRIKKSSAVVCGGVPVDLSRLPWPSGAGKTIGLIAAGIVLLAGITFGLIKLLSGEVTAEKIYKDHSNSMVMLVGTYHYEVSAGDLDLEDLGYATKFLFINGEPVSKDRLTEDQFYQYATYTGTGFFISDDGQIVTNLHIVKPWLFSDPVQEFEAYYKKEFAKLAETRAAVLASYGLTPEGLSAYISQIKVEGVSDGIFLVPQGSYFSATSAQKCRVLSAGKDVEKDVALIQSEQMDLPNKHATFINLKDLLDTNEEVYTVGRKVFMLGFPHGIKIQDREMIEGIQVFCHEGHITNKSTEYGFISDATAAGGASGSPIFNGKGKVIGILNSAVDKENFCRGIKASYIKELIDGPRQK